MNDTSPSKISKILEIIASSKVEEGNITTTCDQSFLNYSLSVITSRALPDLRDGLKPVHRRILYAAYEERLFNEGRFKKSATLVGAVMGSYHPHGDKSIYDALVRLSQDFKMRYPLLEGQGNFGSIDGDAPAAMRYTEVKMSKLGQKFLEGIKEECVEFLDNYDGSKKEPSVLPIIAPSILLNGSEGIAVGMATKIPSHNLKEVCEAAIALIDNPQLEDERLIDYIKGPDFATGCEILGTEGIKKYLKEGIGKIWLRAKVELNKEKNQLIIREIPFGIVKSKLIKKIATLSTIEKKSKERKNAVLQRFILNIRDESNLKEGIRLIIQCREGSDLNAVLNNLYKYTALQTQYTFNLTLLNKGKPERMGVGGILRNYLIYQVEVLKRKTNFNLRKLEERIHLLEGRWVVVNDLQEVIRIITEEESPEEKIKSYFNDSKRENRILLSEKQIDDIFSLPLRQLKKIERKKLKDELDEKKESKEECLKMLSNEKEQFLKIKKDLKQLIGEFDKDRRKTQINDEQCYKIGKTELIPEENLIIKCTSDNYIGAVLLNEYRVYKGVSKGEESEHSEDRKWGVNSAVLVASSKESLYMFTNYGRVYKIEAHLVKVGEKKRWPKNPEKLDKRVNLKKGEKVVKIITFGGDVDTKNRNLFLVSKRGYIKRLKLENLRCIKKNGKLVKRMKEGDELGDVTIGREDGIVIIVTRKGKMIKFDTKKVKLRGRLSGGIRGIRLNQSVTDEVVGVNVGSSYGWDVIVTKSGQIKKVKSTLIKTKNRGGKGICVSRVGEEIAAALWVDEEDWTKFIVGTKNGKIVSVEWSNIPERKQRVSRGKDVIKLDKRKRDSIDFCIKT